MNFRSLRMLSVILKKNYSFVTTNINQYINIYSRNILKCKFTPIFQQGSALNFSECPPKCWQCDYPYKSELFCSKCKALQKLPKDLNYFDIIGIKKSFDVTTEDVKKKYRRLQSLLHPDKFGQKSDREKEISENLSSLVNKAYSTLIHPLDRGIYMLKLNNIFIKEDTNLGTEPEFLMEIMEKNEEIEEASENKEKTLEFLHENHMAITSLTKQISEAFDNKDYEKAKKLLIKLKFYISIDERLKKLKQDLGIVE